MVGSVLYEMPGVITLIDPLLPSEDRAGFLAWLDVRGRGPAREHPHHGPLASP